MERKKLMDILRQPGGRDQLTRLWETTTPAEEFVPLPPGDYTFRILSGDLFRAKTGTPGYRWTLEVTEGQYKGRLAWADFWLTADALPMTKRDLAKIGIDSLADLEQPLPPGILIRGRLIIRRSDDWYECNRLLRFECAGVEEEDANPFAPTPDQLSGDPNKNGTPPANPDGRANL
jgi:hypothetical protein